MQAAKALIDDGEYDEARRILTTVNHPTAREWEEKLDRIAPQEPDNRRRNFYFALLFIAFLLTCAFFVAGYLISAANAAEATRKALGF